MSKLLIALLALDIGVIVCLKFSFLPKIKLLNKKEAIVF